MDIFSKFLPSRSFCRQIFFYVTSRQYIIPYKLDRKIKTLSRGNDFIFSGPVYNHNQGVLKNLYNNIYKTFSLISIIHLPLQFKNHDQLAFTDRV